MRPSEREPFILAGAWWRTDGPARVAATEPPEELHGTGLDDGIRHLDAPFDLLLGKDAAHPCYGVLRSRPGAAFHLELPGASGRVFDDNDARFTVHGVASDGAPCTIADCFTTSTSQSLMGGGYRAVELAGHLLIHGAHIDDVDGFSFDRARVELAGLRELFTGRLAAAAGRQARDPLADGPIDVSVAGARLSFCRIERRRPSLHALSVEHDVVVDLRLDAPLTHAQWQRLWVTPLLNFVELATREPSRLHDFIAFIEEPEAEIPPMLRGRVSAESFRFREAAFAQPRTALRATEPRHDFTRALLDISALDDDLQPALATWFELVGQLREPLGWLLSTLSSQMYVTSQLVVLASVAEAYHRNIDTSAPIPAEVHERAARAVADALGEDPHHGHYQRIFRYANQRSQTERITALLQRAAQVVAPFGRKSGRLADRLVQTRNALVHLPAEQREILTGVDLVEAVELLVLALHANLLLDLGVEPDRAARLIEHSYGRQLLWQRLCKRDCAWPKGRARPHR